MAKVDLKHPFPGRSADECYQACLRIVEKAGYKLFKKRDVAWLVICNGKVLENNASLTLSIPFGGPTAVSLSLSCDHLEDAALKAEADRIFDLLGKEF